MQSIDDFLTPSDPAEESNHFAEPEINLEDLLAECMATKSPTKPKSPKNTPEHYAPVIREWRAVASTAYFHTQICSNCGSAHTATVGLFQHQFNRSSRTDRWIKSDTTANVGLPKEVKLDESFVSICSDCSSSSGFAFPVAAVTRS